MTNPSEEDIQARIVEELGPEPNWASMTPDQVELRKKSRQFDEVHIRLSYNKEAAQVFKDIMGEFSAERVPIEVTQADIKKVVKGQEHLEQIFSQFLEVDLDAGDDQNRVRARKALCDCSGGGGTRKWTGEANRPNLVELLFFLRVQVGLRSSCVAIEIMLIDELARGPSTLRKSLFSIRPEDWRVEHEKGRSI
jgi:hypothetical protein